MKQFWRIWFILVLTALTGCVKAQLDPVPEREITFTVGHYASADTKAASLESYSINSFSSKGFLHAEGYEGTTQDFFGTDGETITWNNTDEIWSPSHPYYWPKGASSYINFVSWYDKNGNPTSVTEDNISWTFDGSSRTLAADDDIMVAKKAWNQKMNVQNYYTPGVPTLFKHLLAQIEFKVKAAVASETVGSVTTTWAINVTGFTLTGVYSTGSLSLTNSIEPEVEEGEPCISDWTGSWTTSGDPTSINGQNVNGIGASAQSVIARRSVIPQAISGKSVSFNYTIVTTTKNNDTEETHVLEETMSSGSLSLADFTYSEDWEANKIITYTISISAKTGAITMTPSVQDIDSSLLLNIE